MREKIADFCKSVTKVFTFTGRFSYYLQRSSCGLWVRRNGPPAFHFRGVCNCKKSFYRSEVEGLTLWHRQLFLLRRRQDIRQFQFGELLSQLRFPLVSGPLWLGVSCIGFTLKSVQGASLVHLSHATRLIGKKMQWCNKSNINYSNKGNLFEVTLI